MPAPCKFEGLAGGQSASNGAGSGRGASVSARPSATIAPALLTDDQSAEFLGVSRRKFHELRAEPWWPVKAVVLGPRLLRWPRAELEQAVASMPRQAATGSEPAHLRRAKIEAMKKRGVPA